MKSLLIGRWQPFHKGHLELVRQAKKKGEVVLAICSADKSHMALNPFTAGERYDMISAALKEAKLDVEIIALNDTGNHGIWVELVRRTCPEFNVIVSGNQFVSYLFRERGFKVEEPSFFEKDKYNATKIREIMFQDGDWEKLVPEAVVKIIERINGVERVKFSQKAGLKNE